MKSFPVLRAKTYDDDVISGFLSADRDPPHDAGFSQRNGFGSFKVGRPQHGQGLASTGNINY